MTRGKNDIKSLERKPEVSGIRSVLALNKRMNNYYKIIMLYFLFVPKVNKQKTLIPKFSLKMNNRLKSVLQQNVA